ncbi:hypothetical protein IRJ41_008650 [Triplophysa rosa]|uniref:CCHC-type domain-containing protein n=1 Tax=Triplophysa rosa TaxID=992332 RepID=A0A9W7TIY7_TRIRA|nr:hypothetical protein IRJ41_008650 [Triplophysa rosa]
MEEELQELRETIAQLKADNERLCQECSSAPPVSVDFPPAAPGPSIVTSQPSSNEHTALPERYVFIPLDRRCPKFNGRVGLSIDEWVEEAQACMQARHMSVSDKAFFLFDHLEGEAREEIRYRPDGERNDPVKIVSVLREVYGCSQSYVSLQEAFFSRRQREGESLLEFSLALMGLLEQVKQKSPYAIPNCQVLLRDQFVEHVCDSALRRELKQLIRCQPTLTLLEVRSEALRWEREGMPGSSRGRSHSLPSVCGIQYGVQGGSRTDLVRYPRESELGELREMLKVKQDQLNKLTQSFARLQGPRLRSRSPRSSQVICRRCQKPGHFARECDGEHAPPRTHFPSVVSSLAEGGQPGPSASSGN